MRERPEGAGGHRAWGTLIFTALVLAGCGGSDGPTDPDPGPDPSFAISVSPSTLSVDQGSEGQVTLSVSRSGGFTGSVSVAVEGLPSGVSAGSNLSVPGGSSSLTVTLTAAEDAAPGSASVTFRGTAGQLPAQTASMTLTINEVSAPEPDFALSLDPSSLSIERGSSGEVSVAVTRSGGFEGSVTLSAVGLPDGVSASFDPEELSDEVSTLTLSAGGSASTGTVSVTISGSSPEVGTRDAALSLEITAPDPPPPGGGSVTWLLCGEGATPPFVAIQDGDGPWTRIEGEGNGSTFTFDINASRGGVAWVENRGFGTHLEVFLGTVEELQFFGRDRCDDAAGEGFSVSGSVEGVESNQQARVTLGSTAAQVIPQFGLSFTISGVRPGTQDLVATLSSISSAGNGQASVELERILLRRDLNPTPGSTLAPVDFDGSEAFDPIDVDVTIQNLNGQTVVANSLFFTSNGTTAFLLAGGQGSTSPNQTVQGIPLARTVSGDLQSVMALAFPGDPSEVSLARGVFAYGAPQSSLTIALGPNLTDPFVQALPPAGDGTARIGLAYPIQSAYDRNWTLNLSQGGATGSFRNVAVQLSAGYRGSSTGQAELEVPDLSEVEGWNSSWGLEIGRTTEWQFSATGGDPVMEPLGPGVRIRFGHQEGEITP